MAKIQNTTNQNADQTPITQEETTSDQNQVQNEEGNDEISDESPSTPNTTQDDDEEKEEEQSKTVENGMLVCHGALCNCSLGTMPSQLIVTSNKKYYVNDPQGAQKMVATVKDSAAINLNFGLCKNGSNPPPPCAAELQWQKEHSNISIDKVGNVLSENSEATCTKFGGKVSILQNGQIPQVNAQNFKNVSVAAPAANCLVDAEALEELKKEDPLEEFDVYGIKCREICSDKNTKKVEQIKIRPGESLDFNAYNLKNANPSGKKTPSEREKKQIDWIVTRDGSPLYAFGNHGVDLNITFEEPGNYRVEAHRRQKEIEENKASVLDENCSLDVIVIHNRITNIKSEEIRKASSGWKIRAGMAAYFELEFDMEPIAEEIERIYWEFEDMNGGCVKMQEKGVTFIVDEINVADYELVAHLDPQPPFSLKLKGENNSVQTISSEVNGMERSVIRPDECISFSVRRGQYDDNLTEEEQKLVKWKHYFNKTADAGDFTTGGSIPAQTFEIGHHIMEAYVKEANALKKAESDDFRFTVTHNYIHYISGDPKPKLGSKNNYYAKPVMAMTPEEKSLLKWKKVGSGKYALTKSGRLQFEPDKLGKCKIIAYIDNTIKKKFGLTLDVQECRITKAAWSDEDGNRIGRAGYKQDVYIYFEHVGLEGETVQIDVYDDDSTGVNIIYSVTESIPRHRKDWHQVEMYLSDDIRKKIEAKGFSKYGELFFKITGKTVTITNDTQRLPTDKRKYLRVDNKKELVKAYFADPADRKRLLMVDYSDKVNIQLYTTNMVDEEVEVNVMERMEHSTKTHATEKVCIDYQGQASIEFDLCVLQNDYKGSPLDVREIYLVVKLPDKEHEGRFVLKVFHELDSGIRNKEGQAVVTVETVMGETEECKQHAVQKGDKGNTVKEINIRLAGFGGSIPSEEFTDQTELVVKQFQRDYMNIEPTGRVCKNTLLAIEEFGLKYIIPFEQLKCPCGECKGFGNEKFKNEYNDESIQEKYRKYEYPGIHRSLLWATKALMFYLETKFKSYGYKIGTIASGYRCHENNAINNRTTTNHMGKAIDLHIFSIESNIRLLKDDCDKVRNILSEISNAQIRWNNKNVFSMEPSEKNYPTEFISPSWIHIDVREFSIEYLSKDFFVKDESNLRGESLISLARIEKLNVINCTQIYKRGNNYSVVPNNKKDFNIEDAKIALQYIFKNFGRERAEIIEKIYRLETTHFTSFQYKKTGTSGMESHGNAPYYGWDKSFFEKYPEHVFMGLISMKENKGIGYNQQSSSDKKFVIFPSVEAGMTFLSEYIDRYDGNFARWYSTTDEGQEKYKSALENISSKIVNDIK